MKKLKCSLNSSCLVILHNNLFFIFYKWSHGSGCNWGPDLKGKKVGVVSGASSNVFRSVVGLVYCCIQHCSVRKMVSCKLHRALCYVRMLVLTLVFCITCSVAKFISHMLNRRLCCVWKYVLRMMNRILYHGWKWSYVWKYVLRILNRILHYVWKQVLYMKVCLVYAE